MYGSMYGSKQFFFKSDFNLENETFIMLRVKPMYIAFNPLLEVYKVSKPYIFNKIQLAILELAYKNKSL